MERGEKDGAFLPFWGREGPAPQAYQPAWPSLHNLIEATLSLPRMTRSTHPRSRSADGALSFPVPFRNRSCRRPGTPAPRRARCPPTNSSGEPPGSASSTVPPSDPSLHAPPGALRSCPPRSLLTRCRPRARGSPSRKRRSPGRCRRAGRQGG